MTVASPVPLPTSLEDWLRHAEGLHSQAIDLGLDRFNQVKDRLGLVASAVSIVVAGTNGKGSTCAMLEAIYVAAGYRVGKYASPHLLRFGERIRVQARDADDDMLCRAFQRVEAARQTTGLTYFEFTTLAAFCVFEEARTQINILEVGLGGRLDAVNAIDADCAVVTTIGLDHMAWLGHTRDQIAWEKAHVFRSGRPAICVDPEPPPSLLEHAATIGARLFCLQRDFSAESVSLDGRRQWNFHGVTPSGSRHALPEPALRGPHQIRNAAGVLAVLEQLAERCPVHQQAVRQGLTGVGLPGRFQVLPGRPTTILDVAHNGHAAQALAQALAQHAIHAPRGRTLAVFGLLRDKDALPVMTAMLDQIDTWFLTSTTGERGLDHADLATDLRRAHEVVVASGSSARPLIQHGFATVAQALSAARESAGPDDRIIVFGSFLVVADAMRCLEPSPR